MRYLIPVGTVGGLTERSGENRVSMSGQRGWRLSNVPVPEGHVALLAVAGLLTVVRPRPITAKASVRCLGWPLIGSGVALGVWATRTAGRTDLVHPDHVITGGPYALSRHPMYVAWTLAYVGTAIAANTKWPLVLTPLLAGYTHREALREEERLREEFGADYEAYQAEVRRYL